ncbi:helix-turn-helix domain-containing protein [Klenkia marina]|nr:helix-turn-helix domain-containing protein [Klenkia marina]
MTTSDVADRLNMTVRGVRVAIETGRLRAERQHGRWFVTREEFEHFKTVRRQRAA